MDLVVCVPAGVAQVVRKKLEEHKLWDDRRKLQKHGDSVAIPVYPHDPHLSDVLQHFPNAEVKEIQLPPSAKSTLKCNGRMLKDSMKALLNLHMLSEALLLEVPKKWERHGDLIILPSSAFISSQWQWLGEELWLTVCSALSCKRLAQHSHVADNDFRSPQVSMLLGHDGNVLHIDNGIKYNFDVTKCMFSSGNITEKLRVASWNCSNEIVVDLYAGIGYFTLPYLVHAMAHHVHACEWNPDAVSALKNNLILNGVEDRCTVYEGDNRKLQLSNEADRVNLGLIPSSEASWPVAVRVLKETGGMLHIHANVDTSHAKMKEDTHNQEQQKNDDSVHSNSSLSLQSQEPVVQKQRLAKQVFHNESCNFASNGHNSDGSHHVQNERIPEKQFEMSVNWRNRFITKPSPCYRPWAENVAENINRLLVQQKGGGWICDIIHVEKVKSYAPRIDHIVLDLRCRLK